MAPWPKPVGPPAFQRPLVAHTYLTNEVEHQVTRGPSADHTSPRMTFFRMVNPWNEPRQMGFLGDAALSCTRCGAHRLSTGTHRSRAIPKMFPSVFQDEDVLARTQALPCTVERASPRTRAQNHAIQEQHCGCRFCSCSVRAPLVYGTGTMAFPAPTTSSGSYRRSSMRKWRHCTFLAA